MQLNEANDKTIALEKI